MRNRTRRFSSTIGIVLSLLVVLLLIALAQFLPNRISTQQAPQPVAQLIEATKPDSPLPTPFTPVVVIEPTWTPWPTMTPWPTPTLKTSPTSTALPTIKPVDNPSGQIVYQERTAFSSDMAGYHTEGKTFAVQVDSKGTLSQPQSMSLNGWYRTYLSPNRNLVALVSQNMLGDGISILNTATGKVDIISGVSDYTGFFSGWSPNNQEVIFLVNNSAIGGLWLINIETGERTIVAQQYPLYILDAAVSPDGQQIIYAQQKDIFSPIELWMVFSNGADAKMISSNGGRGLSWSPDGKKIAYLEGGVLCLVSLDNLECKALATDARNIDIFAPVWSPDGEYLAFVAIDSEQGIKVAQKHKNSKLQDWDKDLFEGSSIHLIQIETGEERVLISRESFGSAGGAIDPAWSPDGSTLAFVGFDGNNASLWTIHPNAAQLQRIIESSNLIRFPVWSSREQK